MRHRKHPVGVREHIGPHAWVRLPDSPPEAVAPDGGEPTDLPITPAVPSGAR